MTTPAILFRSLTGRLLVAALAWLAVVWIGGAFALDTAFRQAQAERVSTKLEILANVVAESLTMDADGRIAVRPLGIDADRLSAWYWQITGPDGTVLRSRALGDTALRQSLNAEPGQLQFDSYDDGPRGQPVATVETAVRLPGLPDGPVHLKVALAESDFRAALVEFRGILATASILLFLGLALAIVLQLRWGLQPIRRVIGDLERVKAGATERLDEHRVPREMHPLVAAFNDTLEHDRRNTRRTRDMAADLAHALKTELAVLRSEIGGADAATRPRLDSRVARLTELVERHLGRGGMASGHGGHGATGRASSDTAEVVAEIAGMLRTVYGHRGLTLTTDIAAAPSFRGDRQDLVEMVGNLMENACKHAHTRVAVTARHEGDRLRVRVDDDGPGLPHELHQAALQRGRRLDEQVPGSGLGLAIVNDLVTDYGGTLGLDASALGGLAACLDLPAVAGNGRTSEARDRDRDRDRERGRDREPAAMP